MEQQFRQLPQQQQSDEETDMEILFKERDASADVFYFTRMRAIRECNNSSSGTRSRIEYYYSYSQEVEIMASMTVDFDLLSENGLEINILYYDTVVSIGMCILLYYWMGFACPVIIIEPAVRKFPPAMTAFWKHFYEQLLLEYCFVNKLKVLPVLQVTEEEEAAAASVIHLEHSDNSTNSVILPLGGGKDSLVAWHMSKAAGNDIQLLYVADSFYEFESSWRLRYIVDALKLPLHLVRHEFHCEQFERCALAFYSLTQLNPHLSQFNPDLSQLNPHLLQLNRNLSQFNPNLIREVCEVLPAAVWSSLGSTSVLRLTASRAVHW
jgi:hypothetical protein